MPPSDVPKGGRPSMRSFIVSLIVILMMLPTLPFVTSLPPDPTITKVSNGYDAVWDFSDPVNYTYMNTTIDGGQLKLAPSVSKAADLTSTNFLAGTRQQVRVLPKGSLVLTYKGGTGFTDVTATAGVSGSGATGGRSVAWGDYNNDGLMDLLVGPNNRRNLLFKNNGDGTFSDVSTSSGIRGPAGFTAYTSTWGDYNNDGSLDLAQVTSNGVYLWKNNADGTFTEASAAAGITSSGSLKGGVWLDYNHDGYLDLFVDGGPNNQHLWKNNKAGSFSDDVIAMGLVENTGADGYVTAASLNNDSFLDLIKNQEQQDVKIFDHYQQGNGNFTEVATFRNFTGFKPNEPGADSLDVNNDGKIDLYWAASGQDSLWVNQGNTHWNMTAYAGMTENRNGRSSAIADYNLDGTEDIFVPSTNNQPVLMWQNSPSGKFTDASASWGLSGTFTAEGSAWADYNNDGNPDIYMTQSNTNGGHLFQNNFASDNFIKVKLVGDKTNKAAIGARLELYNVNPQNSWILEGVREVKSSTGSGNSNSLEQIFGVNGSMLYTLVVRFPGGKVVNITGLQAPAYIQVSETGAVTPIQFTHHYTNIGNFTSRTFDLGTYVSLGNIYWNATVPQNTNIVVKTRTSSDGASWNPWSTAYVTGDPVKGPKERYIQYMVQMSSTNPNLTPEVFNVTMTYWSYCPQGTAVTKIFNFNSTAINMVFSSFGTTNQQAISFSYSKNAGKTWKPIPPGGNMSSETFTNITLRAEVSTHDVLVTPMVQYMKIHYALNQKPSVKLLSPANNAYAGTDQELKWNGTDPERQALTYDVYIGTVSPYPKVVSNLQTTSYIVKNLVPGRTYFWYIIAKDTCNATSNSTVWTFLANSPPTIDLQYPPDKSTLNTNKVRFQWLGVDNAGLPLSYDLYVEKDGVLTKAVNGTDKTIVQLSLENRKTYKWYVIGNDGLLTNRSPTWNFTIYAPLNHLPQVNNTPPATAVVGKPYDFNLQIYDADGDQVLPTFITGHQPPGMVLTTTGGIKWTPSSPGTYSVGILLDDKKDQVQFWFNVTVTAAPPNKPPKIVPIPDKTLKNDPVTVQLSDYVSDDGGLPQVALTCIGGNPKLFSAVMNGTKLTITPMSNVKGTANLTVVATDSLNAKAQYTFNVTVDNTVGKKQDLFSMLCPFWPVFLIILIVLIIAIVLTVRARRKLYRVERPVEKKENIETWDQMQGDLVERHKPVEEEEGSSFRGSARGQYGNEAYATAPTVYVPMRTAPPPVPEQTYEPAPQPPVFGETYVETPAPGPVEEKPAPGPNVWKPVAASEDETVYKEDKRVKAEQDAEIDDILKKLKVGEPEEPKVKKVPKKEPDLDDLLSKLKKR